MGCSTRRFARSTGLRLSGISPSAWHSIWSRFLQGPRFSLLPTYPSGGRRFPNFPLLPCSEKSEKLAIKMPSWSSPFLSRRRRTRPITAFSLLTEQIEKQPDRFVLPAEMMHHHLSLRADPTPPAQQADVSEQVRFDGHRIIARHVSRGVQAFDIQVIGLRYHEIRIADLGTHVQRHL